MAKRSKSRRLSSPKYYLPEEIIYKVLTWTPASSLFRFRSVSKSWRSIISNPKFINTHFTNSHKIPSLLTISLVLDGDKDRTAACCYSAPFQHYISRFMDSPFHGMEFVASSHGILCVSNYNCKHIYLLNPLTGDFKELPVSNYQPPDDREPIKVDLGFGYDCVADEYKVVRIIYQRNANELMDVVGVEVCSKGTDSWREIRVDIALGNFRDYPFMPVFLCGPVVDGVLYFDGMNEILSLDLYREAFKLIQFPVKQSKKSNVFDYHGSVAMVFESVGDGEESVGKEISLWTLEAVCDEVFWTKEFSFEAEIDWVFLYMGAKQFVGKSQLGRMLLYDYTMKETRDIRVPAQSSVLRLLKHQETFLSIE